MKKSKMKKLKGLLQFKYCDVASSFELTASSDLDYFKNKIHKKAKWNSKEIDLSATPDTAAFDAGIVCATSDALPLEINEISKLDCYFAPYKFMQNTIGTLKEPCKRTENPNSDNLGIAIGMVLSIIATKGSAENGNRTPYMLFVKRGDLEIRGNQLDVPVVEGINCGDFEKSNNGKYIAELSEITKRALEEERGIKVDFLLQKGLLHMPKKYYFGYDAEYCQWNFFGTVVIDCTIEEIIREGAYYTKDKFETKQIIGIPAEPRILYYYLSDKMIPIHNRNNKKDSTNMWITAWASVIFATKDYYKKNEYKKELKKCLHRKNNKWLFKGYGRKALNQTASLLVQHEHVLEIAGALFAGLLIVCFAGPFIVKNDQYISCLGNFERLISLLMGLMGAWIVVALTRYDKVHRNDIIKLDTYWEEESEKIVLCPEILVFRNVILKDGNVAETMRNIHFHYERISDLNGTIIPQRKCQMSYTSEAGDLAWGMRDFTKNNVEDILWIIKCYSHADNNIRIIAPLIIKKCNIVFKQKSNSLCSQLSHCVDFDLSYNCFVDKNDADIEKILKQEIESQLCEKYSLDMTIHFKFLLEYRGQCVIVAFLESDMPSSHACPLTYDLTETTFSQRMKDDITRVACEYAIAEYLGYKMSNR